MQKLLVLFLFFFFVAIKVEGLDNQSSGFDFLNRNRSKRAATRGCDADPGDCSIAQCHSLQANVNKTKGTEKCTEADSRTSLEEKLAGFMLQLKARSKINSVCFRGGDSGHIQAVQDTTLAIGRCSGIISKLK